MNLFNRKKDSVTMEVDQVRLRNLLNYIKDDGLSSLYGYYYPVEAKTDIYGQLRFKIEISQHILDEVKSKASLDALLSGVLE
jgi:hypothetical protein